MAIHELRRWLNRYQTVVTLIAIAVMLAALGIIFTTIRSQPTFAPVPVYYFDVNTGELFAAMSDRIPPISAPSDDTMGDEYSGVRAYVYSCSSCDDLDSRFIAYLETYTLDMKFQLENEQMLAELGQNPVPMHGSADGDPQIVSIEEGHLVRAVESEQWVGSLSEEGARLIETAALRCENNLPQMCVPDASTPLFDHSRQAY